MRKLIQSSSKGVSVVLVGLAVIVLIGAGTLLTRGYVLFQNPQDIITGADQRYSNVAKATIDYDVSFKLKYSGITTQLNGTMQLVKVNNNSMVYISFDDPYSSNKKTEARYYYLNGKEISCDKSSYSNTFYCSETTKSTTTSDAGLSSSVKGPDSQRQLLKDWLKQGIVTLSYDGQSSYLGGRACDKVSANFDVDKFLKNLTLGTTSIDKDKAVLKFSICFDKETGADSGFDMNFDLGTIAFDMDVKGKALKLDANEKLLALPVPDDQVYWKPVFTLSKKFCTKDSTTITITLTAKDNVPSGTAVLNVSSYNYSAIPSSTYMTTTTPFGGANAGDEQVLSFTLPSKITANTNDLKVTIGKYSATAYCDFFS